MQKNPILYQADDRSVGRVPTGSGLTTLLRQVGGPSPQEPFLRPVSIDRVYFTT